MKPSIGISDDYYKKLIYGDFAPTKEDRRVYDLASQYIRETESYDQKICSCRNERGIALPVSSEEFRLINLNAQSIYKRILKENVDINSNELRKAIQAIRQV